MNLFSPNHGLTRRMLQSFKFVTSFNFIVSLLYFFIKVESKFQFTLPLVEKYSVEDSQSFKNRETHVLLLYILLIILGHITRLTLRHVSIIVVSEIKQNNC